MPAGIGQPDIAGILQFDIADVKVLEEGGILPATVLPAGAKFTIEVDLLAKGQLSPLLVGDVLHVTYHVQNLETGAMSMLGSVQDVTVPNPPDSFSCTSGPFTTANTGGSGDLVIPSGYASGTFRILTHIHHPDPARQSIVASYQDELIIMVTE